MIATKDMIDSPTVSKGNFPKVGTALDTTTHRRRLVSFCEVELVSPYPVCDDMTEEEVETCWYTDEEYEEIRQSVYRLALKVDEKPEKYNSDSLSSEMRGLENLTREGSGFRNLVMDSAYSAVFEEQDRQVRTYGDIVDHEAIAMMYEREAWECQGDAIALAEMDAKLVLSEFEKAKSKRRRIAKKFEKAKELTSSEHNRRKVFSNLLIEMTRWSA